MAFKRLVLFTIIVTYILIVFGGYVASSNSGMGCGPDWPLCNGLVIPLLKGATLVEFTHRVIGALLGIMSLIVFFMILKSNVEANVRSAAWGMMILLIIQVLLGAIVVVLDLPAIVVTVHLVIAMIYLYSLIWIWRNQIQGSYNRLSYTPLSNIQHKSVNLHLNIVILLLLFTLAFGAYIKHQSYGLSCGWLGCKDSFVPVSPPEILQTIHRLLAVFSTVYIFILAYLSVKNKWGTSLQKRLTFAAFTVFVQLLVGVATIMTYIDVPWAVLHLAIGTAVFAFISEARIYLGSRVVKTNLNINRRGQQQNLD